MNAFAARVFASSCLVLSCFSSVACTDADTDGASGTTTTGTTSNSTQTTDDAEDGEWQKVEIPGTVCGKGSQYKFFVNLSKTSDNLLITLEPGGACWDYDSCSGKTSLGASNVDGITDGHMALYQLVFPFLRRTDPDNPVRDWNHVYLPYCTGDVHIGNAVRTYVDPNGKEPDLVFHHAGYPNTLAIIDWLKKRFPKIPRMLVYGCSAGGAGSMATYYFYRKGLSPERSYLLDDSGPAFPGSVHSQPLYDQVRTAWDLGSVLDPLPFGGAKPTVGDVSLLVADQFPDDRLGVAYFLRDHVFSAYSYQPFYPDLDDEQRLELWKEDTDLMTAAFDARKNLAYFLPYWRARADSHCTTALDYVGTEIQEKGVDMGDFIHTLLDDSAPLKSYRESPQPGEDGTPAP